MIISLILLLCFSTVNVEYYFNREYMEETVVVLRSLTRIGCILESQALSARLTLKMLLRRGSAVEIDFERHYIADEKVITLQQIRHTITLKYNLIAKLFESTRRGVPSGLPRRIQLEPFGWGVLFQYTDQGRK